MTLGYGYMILSLTCFGLIGIIAKYADLQGCRPSAVYTLAYAWSVGFGLLLTTISGGGMHAPGTIYRIALPFGAASALGGIAFMAGIRFGKISTSWLVINLSAAIPAALSVLIYREPVSPKKIAVLLLATASILLLWKDKQMEEAKQAGSIARPGVIS